MFIVQTKCRALIEIGLSLDEMDLNAAESKATYEEIEAYIKEKAGLQVSNFYIV